LGNIDPTDYIITMNVVFNRKYIDEKVVIPGGHASCPHPTRGAEQDIAELLLALHKSQSKARQRKVGTLMAQLAEA
jgi:hypothetical protein